MGIGIDTGLVIEIEVEIHHFLRVSIQSPLSILGKRVQILHTLKPSMTCLPGWKYPMKQTQFKQDLQSLLQASLMRNTKSQELKLRHRKKPIMMTSKQKLPFIQTQ